MVISETSTRLARNAATLERELAWLAAIIEGRMQPYLGEGASNLPEAILADPPPLDRDDSMYGSFVRHYGMSVAERLTMLLALVPHVQPQLLDVFFRPNTEIQRGHTELGGIQGKTHGGFLPTGETVAFLLAGGDLHKRFESQRLFDRDHYFALHNILKLETAPAGEPALSGQLIVADEIVDFLTTGELRKPDYSRDFPARLITTEMEWDDLVLAATTQEQLRELECWIRHENVLMNDWGLGKRLRPGYRCLFYGPPGTGKTLSATLIGKRVGRDVYRVALSAVVSKYIGETEKNLERIFGRAENMHCILFFDEADALFGKRTNVSDAHDRYANQEVSYLLQRIEDFPGVVILASNYSSNIDDAFMRRFQAVVHFPMPNVTERKRLWGSSFSEHSELDEEIDLDEVSRRYELSGGAIMNVVRYASLMSLDSDSNVIRHDDLVSGVRREMQKDGKTP